MGRFFIMGHGEEVQQSAVEQAPIAPIEAVEPVKEIVYAQGPTVYVDRPGDTVEHIVEVIKYVDRPVEVIVEKEVEVIKEVVVEKEVKIPFEVIKYVTTEAKTVIKEVVVEKEVYKVPPIIWGLIAIESLALIASLFT